MLVVQLNMEEVFAKHEDHTWEISSFVTSNFDGIYIIILNCAKCEVNGSMGSSHQKSGAVLNPHICMCFVPHIGLTVIL